MLLVERSQLAPLSTSISATAISSLNRDKSKWMRLLLSRFQNDFFPVWRRRQRHRQRHSTVAYLPRPLLACRHYSRTDAHKYCTAHAHIENKSKPKKIRRETCYLHRIYKTSTNKWNQILKESKNVRALSPPRARTGWRWIPTLWQKLSTSSGYIEYYWYFAKYVVL